MSCASCLGSKSRHVLHSMGSSSGTIADHARGYSPIASGYRLPTQRVWCDPYRSVALLCSSHSSSAYFRKDIKPANVLLELTHLDPEHQQDFWIQHLFDCIPVPTGISYPTFDYVQSRSIYAPVGDPSMVKIQLADFGTGKTRLDANSNRSLMDSQLVGRVDTLRKASSLYCLELLRSSCFVRGRRPWMYGI